MFQRLALDKTAAPTPAAQKVLAYLQGKLTKITFEWSDEQKGIIANTGSYALQHALAQDKWTELDNGDDYDAPVRFKRQTMAISVEEITVATPPKKEGGKPGKAYHSLIKVQDKVVIPPAQQLLAKWKKDLFGSLSGVEAHVSSGSLSWSKRGGHSGDKVLSDIVKRAKALGFTKVKQTPGNSPDGSHVWSGEYYQGPNGEMVKVYSNYGVWAPDNYFSAEFKLNPKKS